MRRVVIVGLASLALSSVITVTAKPLLSLRLVTQIRYTPDNYVQDGLVAMWDGEWNAGRGVHDPNATVWKDLVGTRDLAMLDMTTSSRCWKKKYAYTAGGALTQSSTEQISEARAIECVHMRTADGRAYASPLVWNGFVNGTTESYNITTCILTWHHEAATGGLQVAYDKFASFDTPIDYNTIYTFTAQYSISFRNAIGMEVQTLEGDSWGYMGDFQLACRDELNSYNSPGRFYCIRIYNRELSANEVAHNYAVDKARFH